MNQEHFNHLRIKVNNDAKFYKLFEEFIYLRKHAEDIGFTIPGVKFDFDIRVQEEYNQIIIRAIVPGERGFIIFNENGWTESFYKCCKIAIEYEHKIFAKKNLYSVYDIKQKGIEKIKDEAYANYFHESEESSFGKFNLDTEFNKNWKPKPGENYKGYNEPEIYG